RIVAQLRRLLGRARGLFGVAHRLLGRSLPALFLERNSLGAARLDVGDVFVREHGQEAQDRVVEPRGALELGDHLPVREEMQDLVVALLEVADLVGEAPAAPVLVEQLLGLVMGEDALEALGDRLDAFVRDLRLDDERELVLAQDPSWTAPGAGPARGASRGT